MRQRILFHKTWRMAIAATLISAVTLTANAVPSDKRSGGFAVDTENFGKVNDHFYRGAQPEGRNYDQLAALGVKTIVDLREDAKGDARSDAERAGLRYINLPMRKKSYPQPDAAARFLRIVNDEANWPVYVHCAGGRHRTGVMTAVYRMSVDGWDIEKAYHEMKQYDFYTGWGHGCYKDYVYDYYRGLQAHHQREQLARGKDGN
jgi:tyrosine-protein phosphatase SIW14